MGPAAASSAVAAHQISLVDRWISRAAAAAVVGLVGHARAISYSHMHQLVAAHGDAGWHATRSRYRSTAARSSPHSSGCPTLALRIAVKLLSGTLEHRPLGLRDVGYAA